MWIPSELFFLKIRTFDAKLKKLAPISKSQKIVQRTLKEFRSHPVYTQAPIIAQPNSAYQNNMGNKIFVLWSPTDNWEKLFFPVTNTTNLEHNIDIAGEDGEFCMED